MQSKNTFVNNKHGAQKQLTALRNPNRNEELSHNHQTTSTTSSSIKKRKKLAKVTSNNNNSSNNQIIKDEHHHMQLEIAYESRNQLQNEKKNDDYFEGERRRIATGKTDHSLADSNTLLSAAFSIQTNQTSTAPNHELDAHCDQLDKYRTFPLAESELVKSQNNQAHHQQQSTHLNHYKVAPYRHHNHQAVIEINQTNELELSPEKQETDSGNSEFNQLR